MDCNQKPWEYICLWNIHLVLNGGGSPKQQKEISERDMNPKTRQQVVILCHVNLRGTEAKHQGQGVHLEEEAILEVSFFK